VGAFWRFRDGADGDGVEIVSPLYAVAHCIEHLGDGTRIDSDTTYADNWNTALKVLELCSCNAPRSARTSRSESMRLSIKATR
jgi:hypothetical protein